jgi:PiT family inorganic phosphate transporter
MSVHLFHLFSGELRFGTVPFGRLTAAVWLPVAPALLFDFLNGFHDAANSVATVVATRVLRPLAAVAWAAFFNFVAFLVFGLGVAATIGKGLVEPGVIDNRLVAAVLVGACAWDVLTWYLALPTSSSHALVGGLVGAALAKASVGGVQWREVGVIVLFIFVAPLIGMALGYLLMTLVTLAFRRARPRRVDRVFRRGQLLSAALYSLGHGGNDAQKTMGIIFALLIADSHRGGFAAPAQVPVEVVLACHLAMGLGTLFGGWRIIHTMGQRLIRLRPVDGFCAEVGSAATLGLTVAWGVPVSTTHTIAGSIVGVGFLRRWRAVRWGVARDVVWAWVLTIPGAALVAAVTWWSLAPLARALDGAP